MTSSALAGDFSQLGEKKQCASRFLVRFRFAMLLIGSMVEELLDFVH